jgi:hypothetical protein
VPEPYPHLAPELRTLAGDALHLWGDAAERHRALAAILDAWETGRPDLDALVARVDAAVVAGLAALGLPRGPVRAVRVVNAATRWLGQKVPDCTLLLAGDSLHQLLRSDAAPDAIFRTWVHESIHARQPYVPGARVEQRSARGYEEGMVEGLARFVTQQKAGMHPAGSSYAYYVQAYAALGRILNLEVEALWSRLWHYPTGNVRAAFVATVDDCCGVALGLTGAHHRRLQTVADTVFCSSRAGARPDPNALVDLWRTVLR